MKSLHYEHKMQFITTLRKMLKSEHNSKWFWSRNIAIAVERKYKTMLITVILPKCYKKGVPSTTLICFKHQEQYTYLEKKQVNAIHLSWFWEQRIKVWISDTLLKSPNMEKEPKYRWHLKHFNPAMNCWSENKVKQSLQHEVLRTWEHPHTSSQGVNKRGWSRQAAADTLWVFILQVTQLRTYSQESLGSGPASVRLVYAALKLKLCEFTFECLTIDVIIDPVCLTQRCTVCRLPKETICDLTFRNIAFTILVMLIINKVRENSVLQSTLF